MSSILKEKYDRCWYCESERNYGEPICLACHSFLFADIVDEDTDDEMSSASARLQIDEKLESNDSGNEDSVDCFEQQHQQQIALLKQRQNLLTKSNLVTINNNTLSEPVFEANATCTEKGGDAAEPLLERLYQFRQSVLSDVEQTQLIDLVPNEVLIKIFAHLDDLSLWNASVVCNKWNELILAEVDDNQWQSHVLKRWSLFNPKVNVVCWHDMYSQLVESSNCVYCLRNIYARTVKSDASEMKTWRHRRLLLELKALNFDPPEGISAKPIDSSCYYWQASITGPRGSPYEGGIFYLYIQIPQSYPLRPPLVRFITKIFHPNVSKHGDIGLDSIHDNWSLALTISKVLISIQSLLTDPYTRVCMEKPIGELYRGQRALYENMARFYTWRFAMSDYVVATSHAAKSRFAHLFEHISGPRTI